MIILAGSSHKALATRIATELNVQFGDVEISAFANGEKRVRVITPVAGQHVCIVQSFVSPVDSTIIELLLLADACERSGAQSVTAIIPWLGYSLQDKVFRDGEPLAARMIADVVCSTFIQRVVLLDLHNPSIAGFFSVPSIHVRGLPLFVEHVRSNFSMDECVVVSPDFGGLKAARTFAEALKVPLVNVDKHRDLSTGEVSTAGVAGEVSGKICLVYDDVINTGGTVVEVAKVLKSRGAKAVHFCVTHGLFAGEGLKKMEDNAIDSVVITDSVEHENLPEKMKVLSVAGVLSGAVGGTASL